MKHDRRLIYTDKSDFTDYCKHEDYVRSIANTITARCRLSGRWNVVSVINEAFYQATALHWDFSSHYFRITFPRRNFNALIINDLYFAR